MKKKIIIHAGAGKHRSLLADVDKVLNLAIKESIKEEGRGALEMAVRAVEVMENSGFLNSGSGSVRQSDGRVRMDGSIALSNGLFSSVLGLPGCWNVSRICQFLLDSKNPMMCGKELETKMKNLGFSKLKPDPDAYDEWTQSGQNSPGTVGAVSFDGKNLCSVTTTGGRAGVDAGRVGDSGMAGCGSSASSIGAVSCTGIGEAIVRSRLADYTLNIMKKLNPMDACKKAIKELEKDILSQGLGGLIAINNRGEVGWAFNTEEMPICIQ